MKLFKLIYISLGTLGVSFMLSSCDKNSIDLVSKLDTDFTNRSLVQVYNGTLGAARNMVWIDGARVTGATFAYASTFPSTPVSFSPVPGFKIFLIKDSLSTTTQPQMSFAENLEAGKNYTIFMYDTLNSVKQKIVTNNIVIPTDTTSRIRFANFVYSSSALPAFDLFSVKRNAVIFSNVQTNEVTDYIPFLSNAPDTLYIRPAGTSTFLQNRTVSGSTTTYNNIQLIITPTRLRNFTVIFRGGYRTDLVGAATVRTLSSFSNY
jgi:hypothetical protein